MGQVLVLHVAEDLVLARSLADALRGRGLAPALLADAAPDLDPDGAAEQSIRAAEAVLAIWSPEAVASAELREHARDARDRAKLIDLQGRPSAPPRGAGPTFAPIVLPHGDLTQTLDALERAIRAAAAEAEARGAFRRPASAVNAGAPSRGGKAETSKTRAKAARRSGGAKLSAEARQARRPTRPPPVAPLLALIALFGVGYLLFTQPGGPAGALGVVGGVADLRTFAIVVLSGLIALSMGLVAAGLAMLRAGGGAPAAASEAADARPAAAPPAIVLAPNGEPVEAAPPPPGPLAALPVFAPDPFVEPAAGDPVSAVQDARLIEAARSAIEARAAVRRDGGLDELGRAALAEAIETVRAEAGGAVRAAFRAIAAERPADGLDHLLDAARAATVYDRLRASALWRALGVIAGALYAHRGLAAFAQGARLGPLDAAALIARGRLAERFGRMGDARETYIAALAAAGPALTTLRAGALSGLGRVALGQGEFEDAQRRLTEAFSIERAMGREEDAADLLSNLSRIALRRRDLQDAEQFARRALGLEERRGRQGRIAERYGDLGRIAIEADQLDEAGRLLNHALMLEQHESNDVGVADRLGDLALLAIRRGDFHEANRLLARAHGMLTVNGEAGKARVLADLMREVTGGAVDVAAPPPGPTPSAIAWGSQATAGRL